MNEDGEEPDAQGWLLAGSVMILIGIAFWHLSAFNYFLFAWSFALLISGFTLTTVGLGLFLHIWR